VKQHDSTPAARKMRAADPPPSGEGEARELRGIEQQSSSPAWRT
jgi:hypothetical protein